MKELYYATLKERLYHKEFSNGLNVFVLPKENYFKTYGLFATNFGSIDTSFVPFDTNEIIKVEDGIAHFLEHKMFELKDGDVSDKFASMGANTNAFTSASKTAYLFSTSSNELECIETLVDFVQEFYITNESVEKEKGIIAQEIKMYDDDPDWRNYFDSIKNLYHDHPVNKDIAGTIESVNNTTKEMLELCYQTFYHPSNMVLFIIGNINTIEVFDLLEENQNKKNYTKSQEIMRKEVFEPKTIFKKEELLKMEVSIPKLMVSMKINNVLTNPIQKIKREMAMSILNDLLFSKSSNLYQEWLKEDLIDDSFGAGFNQERDYAFLQIGGDTTKAEELKEKIFSLIKNISQFEIKVEDFERMKKKLIGNYINMFNSLESIANLFIRYYFEGFSIFEIIDILEDLEIEDITQLFELFNENLLTTSIILPKN